MHGARRPHDRLDLRPDGGIGRHEGLKIPWPLRPYGFESRSGHNHGRHRPSSRDIYSYVVGRFCSGPGIRQRQHAGGRVATIHRAIGMATLSPHGHQRGHARTDGHVALPHPGTSRGHTGIRPPRRPHEIPGRTGADPCPGPPDATGAATVLLRIVRADIRPWYGEEALVVP